MRWLCSNGEILLSGDTFFQLVDELLVRVEERMRATSHKHHPDLQAALDHILSSGGKRVRPVVALLAGGMLGVGTDRLVTLAAAIELLHTATLVHDDLIDGSLLRRGIPTLNAKWSPAATVLAGDYVFARAAELAAETNSVEVMSIFADTLATIVSGEINQMFESRGLASRQDYYQRIYAKTASMFVLAGRAAALLSDVDARVVEKLHQFGYEIGMAFQIVDDVLDFTGEQTTVGKPVASDLRHGLITLPAIYYLESNPGDPDMQAVINGAYHEEMRMTRLIGAIKASGAIQQAMEEAGQFVDRGLGALDGLPAGAEHDGLVELAKYIVNRDV
jgi:geranylgeranyl pyrophosphate synthase